MPSEAKDSGAAEPQPTLPYVILSRRSAAKNLSLRSLRSFAVYAAQDDVGSNRRCMRRFSEVVAQMRQRPFAALRGCEEILSGVGPRGGSEGSSVTPAGLGPIAQTVRLVAQRGRWFLRRSVGNVDPV